MLNFQNYLVEVFGSNFDYKVPVDKEQQLYDFFMLSFIFNTTEKKVPANPNEADKVRYAVAEVRDKLLPVLQKQMLDAVFFSVCAELRHCTEYNTADDLMKIVDEELGGKYVKVLKAYLKDYIVRSNQKSAGLLRRPDTSNFVEKGQKKDYKKSFHSAVKASPILSDIMEVARVLFLNARWANAYGGRPWSNIAKGWLHLNGAKNANDKMVWIDHVYDLQHNTGSVFTKVESYSKEGGFQWLKRALDWKRDIKTPHALLDRVSSPLRTLGLRVLKKQFGYGYDQYLKDQEPKNKNYDPDDFFVHDDDEPGKKYNHPDDVKLDLNPSPSGWDQLDYNPKKSKSGVDKDSRLIANLYFDKDSNIPYVLSFLARNVTNNPMKIYMDAGKMGIIKASSTGYSHALEESKKITSGFSQAHSLISNKFYNVKQYPTWEQSLDIFKYFKNAILSNQLLPFEGTGLWSYVISAYPKPKIFDQNDQETFGKYSQIYRIFETIENIKEYGFDSELKINNALNKIVKSFSLSIEDAKKLLSAIFPSLAQDFQSSKVNDYDGELKKIEDVLQSYKITTANVWNWPVDQLKKPASELEHMSIIKSVIPLLDMSITNMLVQCKNVGQKIGLGLLDTKTIVTAAVAIARVQTAHDPFNVKSPQSNRKLIKNKINELKLDDELGYLMLAASLYRSNNIEPKEVAAIVNSHNPQFSELASYFVDSFIKANIVNDKTTEVDIIKALAETNVPFSFYKELYVDLVNKKIENIPTANKVDLKILEEYSQRLDVAWNYLTLQNKDDPTDEKNTYAYQLIKLNHITGKPIEECVNLARTIFKYFVAEKEFVPFRANEILYAVSIIGKINSQFGFHASSDVLKANKEQISQYLTVLGDSGVKLWDIYLKGYVEENINNPLEVIKLIKRKTGLGLLLAKNTAALVIAHWMYTNEKFEIFPNHAPSTPMAVKPIDPSIITKLEQYEHHAQPNFNPDQCKSYGYAWLDKQAKIALKMGINWKDFAQVNIQPATWQTQTNVILKTFGKIGPNNNWASSLAEILIVNFHLATMNSSNMTP